MALNVISLVVMVTFYILILVIGVIAARKVKNEGQRPLEATLVAGRNLPTIVGVFTMIATTVGGGYINGTAESVASDGLVWTLAPLGIFIGLTLGGVIFAKEMRDRKYVTMLDPFEERFGPVSVLMIYVASLSGDLFWTASILSALGTSLQVIIQLPLVVAICVSSAVTVSYTMIGQIIAVAYTDIVQLILITLGLLLSLPFVLTNENVGDIMEHSDQWLGSLDKTYSLTWVDLFIAMTFGTIPWQAYFQRVLSVQSGRQAQILSFIGGLGAIVLAIPSVIIGAVGKVADWNSTSLGVSSLPLNRTQMVLPLVLHEFTPTPVAVLGLGALAAAVMSSMDSSILASSTMFTHNIYNNILRKTASDQELLIVQRVAVVVVGVLATIISLWVQKIYGLFILAADIVFVIVFPQLICAVFLPRTNTYGSVIGFCLGLFLRIGAGDSLLNWEPFIPYPYYTSHGHLFPFRTFSMICSALAIFIMSEVFTTFFDKGFLPAICNASQTESRERQSREDNSHNRTEQNIALTSQSEQLIQNREQNGISDTNRI